MHRRLHRLWCHIPAPCRRRSPTTRCGHRFRCPRNPTRHGSNQLQKWMSPLFNNRPPAAMLQCLQQHRHLRNGHSSNQHGANQLLGVNHKMQNHCGRPVGTGNKKPVNRPDKNPKKYGFNVLPVTMLPRELKTSTNGLVNPSARKPNMAGTPIASIVLEEVFQRRKRRPVTSNNSNNSKQKFNVLVATT